MNVIEKAPLINEKLIMWYKVTNLFSKGLNKSQISRKLDIDRSRARRYLQINEEEFLHSNSYKRQYDHKLDGNSYRMENRKTIFEKKKEV